MLLYLSALMTGLMEGAMLFIAVVLVPSWRRSSPAAFREWFAANSPRVGTLMLTLGAASTLATLAALVVMHGEPRAAARWTAFLGSVAVGIVTAAVNEPANKQFAATGISDTETTVLLNRWMRAHWLRIILGMAAFVGALWALA